MPRTQGALNRAKSDEYLIQLLKERGYLISKEKPAAAAAPPADPPPDPPRQADKLSIKAPAQDAAVKIFNTCGLCGSRFEGKPARCPHCGVTFSGWKEDDSYGSAAG